MSEDVSERDEPQANSQVHVHLLLFVLTALSVLYTGAHYSDAQQAPHAGAGLIGFLARGIPFAFPLLIILLVHEFGHYIAARIHKVPASLPYFIPLPILSPFGTMGAVISMKDTIRSRAALLDIGASGPLAGLVVALPVTLYGLATSPVRPIVGPGLQEGQSLLYLALKHLAVGTIPPGHDVFLNPVAFAGWTGLFVTALNLIPIGQLDGGHIAFALLGEKQNRFATILHWGLLIMFALNLAYFVLPVVRNQHWSELGQAINNSLFWLVWYLLLGWMKRASGVNHPPTEPGELGAGRKAIAVFCLVLFVLLFMPAPLTAYS